MSALLNAAVGVSSGPKNYAFEFVIQTSNSNESFSIYQTGIRSRQDPYIINWGDGIVEEAPETSTVSHTYGEAGIYTVKIFNFSYFYGFHFGKTTDPTNAGKLLQVNNFGYGASAYYTGASSFRNCVNLTSFISGVTNTGLIPYETFWNCTSLTYIDVSTMLGDSGQYGRTFLNAPLEYLNLGGLHAETASPSRVLQHDTIPSTCEIIGVEDWSLENLSQGGFQGLFNERKKYDKALINYSTQTLPSDLSVSFSPAKYSAHSAAAAARESLISTYGWAITDGGAEDAPFQMTTETTTANETFTIPCQNFGTFDAVIDWGDGSPTSTVATYNDANLTHTYATAGTYQISVSGKFANIYFNNSGDKDKVLSIDNLGTCGMSTLAGAFYGCANMTSFTAGTCDTLGVTSLFRMLADCLNITSCDVSTMNTENVTNMQETFANVGQTTEIVGVENWNTSKVTTMRAMFSMYNALRHVILEGVNVTNFDTSNVTAMEFMFGLWDVKLQPNAIDVSNFNTSKVENMYQMFRRTEIPDLDFRRWDTSKVTSMNFMLERIGSPEETVLGLESLNVQSITSNGLQTASGNIPTEQYDAMLINYAAQSVQTGVTLQVGGGTQYTSGGDAEAARNTLINTYGWTITDGGSVS